MSGENQPETPNAAPTVQSELLMVERLLSLSRSIEGTDVFSTKEPLLCPPWARGAYGGQLIAQALLAAYETVPVNFVVHSIHCHFLAAANVDLPVLYSVHRARDGKNFATRRIHAKQEDRLVFLATASFGRDRYESAEPDDRDILRHNVPMPTVGPHPGERESRSQQSAAGQAGEGQPCDCVRLPVENKGLPSERRIRQWIRARGQTNIGESAETKNKSSPQTDTAETKLISISTLHNCDNKAHRAHVAALAYMSDNYFIGTVFRVHNASRFSTRLLPHPELVSSSSVHDKHALNTEGLKMYFEALAHEEINDNRDTPRNDKRVEMMVTLNHTIFFHNPRHLRANEWLLAEMESPWAGAERGLVLQRIWSHQGTLVATCIQEGVVRLLQHSEKGKL